MGLYINKPNWEPFGKIEYLQSLGGYECTFTEARQIVADLENTKAVVIWVDNGGFEAAAYAFSLSELDAFLNCDSGRPMKTFVLDKAVVKQHANNP